MHEADLRRRTDVSGVTSTRRRYDVEFRTHCGGGDTHEPHYCFRRRNPEVYETGVEDTAEARENIFRN
jgi:hypothetical protein